MSEFNIFHKIVDVTPSYKKTQIKFCGFTIYLKIEETIVKKVGCEKE